MAPGGSFVGTDEAPTNTGEAEQRSSASAREDEALSGRKNPEAERKAVVAGALDAELEALEEVFEREIEGFEEQLEDQVEASSRRFEEQFEALQMAAANLRRFESERGRELYEMGRNLESLAEGAWGEDLERRVEQAREAQQHSIEMRMEAAARQIEVDSLRLEFGGIPAEGYRLQAEVLEELRMMLPTPEELEEIRASVELVKAELASRMREVDRIRADLERALREWRMGHAPEFETLLNPAREVIGDLE